MTSLAGELSRGRRALVLAAWALIVAATALYAVHTASGGAVWHGDALYSFAVTAAAVGIAARVALVREDRVAWSLIAAGALAWSAGDLWWIAAYTGVEDVPYPSVADGLYLAFYPLVYAGLVVLVRGRVRRFHASQWLDGLAAALVVAAIGAAVLLPPIVDANAGSSAAVVATNLGYPLGDLLVLGLVVALTGLMGWRPGRAVGLLVAGCLVFTLADSVYLFEVAAGTYAEGGLLDALWSVAMVAIGLAAWQPAKRTAAGRLEGWYVMVLPGVVAVGAITLLVFDHYARASSVAVWLSASALVVCVVRAGITFRENIAQAVTDALTGLPNRRLFHDRLDAAVARSRRQRTPMAVLVIDLDRFKDVNDSLGHASGDHLLQEVAVRLRDLVREGDTVARLGGDEFAVLLPGVAGVAAAEGAAASIAAALARPLVLDGVTIAPQASVGVAVHPDHGATPADLLRRADLAMYTAKAGAYADAAPAVAAQATGAGASPPPTVRGPRPVAS
ncbi:GGDEF domain-containing protein [Miltoncostaea oceani]|uniref:GGDEF domain-containing protein n=1 Tax=Miltoncostaea oceani TaxID=2843216 RepID=UPI001C3D86EB|nr:GGDEF domain-containing protein [Miltoncostaea oceani]